jgi:hypothetical protein
VEGEAQNGQGIRLGILIYSKDWPMFRHDAWRSGGTDETGPAQLEVLWQIEIPGPDRDPWRNIWPREYRYFDLPVRDGDAVAIPRCLFDLKDGRPDLRKTSGSYFVKDTGVYLPRLLVSALRLRAEAGLRDRGRAGPHTILLRALSGKGLRAPRRSRARAVPHLPAPVAEELHRRGVDAGPGGPARRLALDPFAGDKRTRAGATILIRTVSNEVNEAPVSTSNHTAFRWDAGAQQWLFNLVSSTNRENVRCRLWAMVFSAGLAQKTPAP